MKSLMCLTVLLLIVHPVGAQEPETLVKGGAKHGGFGGPVARFTSVNGQFGVMLGGHGGWIINHQFILGGGGYGLVNDMVEAPSVGAQGPGGLGYLSFGYGGVELQFVGRPMKLVHFWAWGLIGGGEVRGRQGDRWLTARDGVFVAEPGAGVTLNLTRAVRMDFGAAFRFVTDVETPGLSNSDMSGLSGTLAVSFGHF